MTAHIVLIESFNIALVTGSKQLIIKGPFYLSIIVSPNHPCHHLRVCHM